MRIIGFGKFAATAAISLTLLAGFVPAAAASSTASIAPASSHTRSQEFPHCAQQVNPTAKGQDARLTKVEIPTCFRTVEEATVLALGRSDLLTASSADRASFQAQAEKGSSVAAAGPFILSQVYTNINMGGSSHTFYTGGTNNPCSAGTSYSIATMPSGFANTISSVRAYPDSQCYKQRYHDYANFGGGYIVLNPGSTSPTSGYTNIGGAAYNFGDKIESVVYYN